MANREERALADWLDAQLPLLDGGRLQQAVVVSGIYHHGLTIGLDHPEEARLMRATIESFIGETTGQSPEQVETKLRRAFDG